MESEAKKKQGYKGKPTHPRCRVCEWLQSADDMNGYLDRYPICGIGGFRVKPNAICDKFSMKDSDK